MARLSFRCEDSLIEAVDAARGAVPRERWLRDRIEAALRYPADARVVTTNDFAVSGGKVFKGPDPKSGKK